MSELFLMTDEFVAFSKKIAELHEAKKAKTGELKDIYASFQKEIAAIDEEAKKVQEDWETWKATQETEK